MDFVIAGENRFQRREELFERKLSEITQAAIVYAHDRHFDIAKHPRRRDHGAVTPEHEHQIDNLSQRFFLDGFDGTSGFMLDALALNFRPPDQFDVALAQPFSQTAERLKCVRLMRLDDDAYAFDRGLGHWLE